MNASNLNIVLFEPGIALNTGNIGRTCAATGSALHLIRPFGFRLNEKEIKRAGMDYWERIEVHDYINYRDFLERNPEARIFYATTKTDRLYTEARFAPGDYIMFGNESRGIRPEILKENEDMCIRIPMLPDERCLNLANSAAVVLYEALRQCGFSGLS